MPYGEFLIRIHRLGHSPVTFAREIGYSPAAIGHWRAQGVPKWVQTIVQDKETIEFYQVAFREFNARASDLQIHSGQLLEATNGFISMGTKR